MKQKSRDYLTLAQIATIPTLMQSRDGIEQVKKIMNQLQSAADIEIDEPEGKTFNDFKNRFNQFSNVKIKKKGGKKP